jgi:hypothetical protein
MQIFMLITYLKALGFFFDLKYRNRAKSVGTIDGDHEGYFGQITLYIFCNKKFRINSTNAFDWCINGHFCKKKIFLVLFDKKVK